MHGLAQVADPGSMTGRRIIAPNSDPYPPLLVTLSESQIGCAPLVRLNIPLAFAADGVDVDHKNGIIKNVPFMSVGPALGHGFELDSRSLEALVEQLNNNKTNVKSRISHPELNITGSRDGIEMLAGWPIAWRIAGDQVRGDIKLLKESLVPNHRKFLLSTAEERPTAIGLSVVCAFDYEARADPQTGEELAPLGIPVYCKAVDFVDDPAANRSGLLNNPGGDQSTPNHPALEGEMNKRVRKYLEHLGMATNADEATAKTYLATLDGVQEKIAKALAKAPAATNDQPNPALPETLSTEIRTLGFNPETFEALEKPAVPPQAPGNAPAPNTPANDNAPPATLSAADVQRMIDEGVTKGLSTSRQDAETRITGIRNVASECGLSTELADQHVAEGTDLKTFKLLARHLSQTGTDNQPIRGLHAAAGEDGRASLYEGLIDAISLRCGVPLYEENSPNTNHRRPISLRRGEDGRAITRQPHERAHEFEHLTLVELTRQYLSALGVAGVQSMPGMELAQIATDRNALASHGVGGVALSHSTGDFSGIFANVLNKQLLPEYEQTESTYELFTQERLVNDFKEVKFNQLGHTSRLRQVPEGAEYEYGTMGEKSDVAQIYKFGILIAMTWEMIVNDDLSAFDERALGFAQTARLLEDDEFYTHLLANPTLGEDTKALFHSDHNNLNKGGGAGALSKDTLKGMRKAMATQTGIAPGSRDEAARALNLRPNTLLVPWELEADAAQLVASLVDPTKSNNTPNYRFLNSLQIVPEQRLDADSATAYYLVAANRRDAPAGYRLRMRGYTSPTITQIHTGSSVDGMTYKCRHMFGKKITDFRPWQKNEGA